MRRFAPVLLTLLLASSGVAAGQADRARVQRDEAEQRTAEERLWAVLRAGPGDPQGDARRAADAGDFRLIWTSSMSGHSVLGAHCRFPTYHPVTGSPPLLLATRSYTDMIQDCAGRDAEDCRLAARMDAYAVPYNRTIFADPRFPYADLCGPPRVVQRNTLPDLRRPETLAAPGRILIERPRHFGEVVRRGTPAAVARMLAGSGAAVLDRPDDLGLTPLAWAVIERRADIARLLLARGADPLAGLPNLHGRLDALPLTLALVTGQHALADAMLTEAALRRLDPWPGALIEAGVRGGHVALVRRMLAEPHQNMNTANLLALARQSGSAAMAHAIAALSPDAVAAALEVAIRRHDPALLREALAAHPSLGPAESGRSSPLGSAIRARGPNLDEMVRLLLAAGADPNGPAQWEDSYEVGSSPPTALVTLVALADRPRPGHRPEAEDQRRMDEQRRALQLLLSAGASPRATDAHGRPLAVILVTGQYDPRGMQTRQELPLEWIAALARAGMDVNATWLGSTALDWADALEMTDTATARELARLGGRRIRPPSLEGGSHF